MGGSLQRLEVLLIGLVVLIAGTLVAFSFVVRPSALSAYLQTTPEPLGARAPTQAAAQPPIQPTLAPAQLPTVTVVATSPPTTSAPQVATERVSLRSLLPVAWSLPTIWPWLLLPVGVVAITLLFMRRRTQPLGYTNQTVGQLLAAADPATRASNTKIMRQLADQGLLTPELAATAGIKRKRQGAGANLRLPALKVPAFRMPNLKWPVIRLPKRTRASRQTHTLAIEPSSVSPASETHTNNRAVLADEHPIITVGRPNLVHAAHGKSPVTPAQPHQAGGAWSAEDRALTVAGVLATIWATEQLHSSILALDTSVAQGSVSVSVTIDAHPSEQQQLAALSDRIGELCPKWSVSWQRETLEVGVVTDGAEPPQGGPLLMPILAHGRGAKTTRFLPLHTWRHLGLYGRSALGALHGLLGSLLYSQAPTELALIILDHGEITPLYREVPHLVSPPGTAEETLELLLQVIRRGAHSVVQPLVLVVVKPDDAALHAVYDLITRLQTRPTLPLHLVIVQEHVRERGRELYALLPALITDGGRGPAALLLGQGEWPRRGEARLMGRGMRVEGRPLLLDETAIAAMVSPLRGSSEAPEPALPRTLAQWVDQDHNLLAKNGLEEHREPSVHAAPIIPATSVMSSDMESVAPGDEGSADVAAQRQRLVQAIVTQRQQLLHAAEATQQEHDNPCEADSDRSATPLPAESQTDVDTVLVASVLMPTTDMLPDQDLPAPAGEEQGASAATTQVGTLEEDAPTLPNETDALTSVADGSALDRDWLSVLVVQDAEPRAQRHTRIHSPDAVTAYDSKAAVSGQEPQPGTAQPGQPATVQQNGWPHGPPPLSNIELAALMERVLANDEIMAGDPNTVGVSKNRLIALLTLPKAQARDVAETLMVWLDHAGLLVESARPGGRLRHPRPLTTTEPIEIAARLSKIALPDADTVRAAWAETRGGG